MVIEQLAVWGPDAERPVVSLAEAEAYCRKLAQSHYENFPVVTWALPKSLHQHFHNVYAFCRWADDLGDEVGDTNRALQLLSWWQGELDACYAGDPRHPVFVALAPTIARFGIPQQPFADLICAFEQDQTLIDYDTYDQLLDYCRRSADPWAGSCSISASGLASETRPGRITSAPGCSWPISGRTSRGTTTSGACTCRARTAGGSDTPMPIWLHGRRMPRSWS